jgi:hypothetical protein
MACTPDTVTPKGVLINLNSGSDYTNCTVYTGLTDSTVTGTTDCVNVTGTTCSLTGLSATLMEVYVKIDCEGCCSNTFRVDLDECCGYNEPTPTPACSCSTYRIAFNVNCNETLTWTDCDTGILMTEYAGYFPQYSSTPLVFGNGTVLYLCSCTVPSASCNVSIDLISSGCNLPTPTPTPTITRTPNTTPTPTITRTPNTTPTPTITRTPNGATPTPTPTITLNATPTPTNINAIPIQTGTTTCQGGICNINGSLGFTTIYMAPGDTFTTGTSVYSNASLSTPFPDTNAINPGGSYSNLYNVAGGVLYMDCLKGGGC